MTMQIDQLLEDDALEEERQEEEQTDQDAHKKANRQLSAHVKKLEAENKALRTQVITGHLQTLGLDPEKGLGKAIAKEYEGEMTAEAVAAFAQEEYGHEVATAPEAPPEVVQTQNIDALHNQGQSSVPTPEKTPEQIQQEKMNDPAASREDATSSLTSKVNQFAQQHYGPTGPQAPST